MRTNERAPTCGWFFSYVLEFEGVERSKEVFPVFIDVDGKSDPDLADWLLQRALRGKREEFGPRPAPSLDAAFDSAVAQAGTAALHRLLARKGELAEVNRDHVEHERSKLLRYYEYRTRAAAEKLESVQRIHERVSSSTDPGEQRIIPVWAKNLESARRLIADLQDEQKQRLSDLAGREQVSAQHELLSLSYVELVPE